MTRSAAALLAETLDKHGVDLIYCVPGESYLAVTDALIDLPQIRLIVCRHESGAAFMAVADAKLRNKPGVCIVSRGPGATNASIAVHVADHDAVPLVLFVGQAERPDLGRRALQEMNFTKTFSDMAKLVIEVNDGKLLAEATARAFHVAQTGSPGPVVVVLPEDMLFDQTDAPALGPRAVARSAPLADDVAKVADLINKAERPVMLVGATYAGDRALADLTRFSEAWSVPICPTHRRPHLFDSEHPNYGGYVGNRVPAPQIAQLKEADLILAVGERLTDSVTQGYSFPATPVPKQDLIHVWPDAVEVGRVWQPTLGLGCDPHAFIEALLAAKPQPAAGRKAWIERLNKMHRELTTWKKVTANDGVVFGAVIAAIKPLLSADAVVTVDAGNFTTWIHRYLYFKQTNMFVGAAVGAMGAGVPSAVAAGLRRPDRQAIAFVGDGGFLMTGNELATAIQYGAPVKIFICNNNCYGTIRMHQELRFPGRVAATELRNPDFAAMARAFGAVGLTIDNDADVEPVVREAMTTDKPVVVDVRASLNHFTAWRRLDEMPAYKAAE